MLVIMCDTIHIIDIYNTVNDEKISAVYWIIS